MAAAASDERMVPAGTTIGQILDYVSGTGDDWPYGLYTFLGVNRNTAVTYAALLRAVTLIAGVVAQLVCGGSLSVVDMDGKRRKSRRVEAALELMTWSPDGGETTARAFVEDCISDYLLDGNALIVPSMSDSGLPTRLRRMLPWDSDILWSKNGERLYRVSPVDTRQVPTEYFAARDVLHVRWPRVLRHGRTRSTREGFALAPVVAMRPALTIGLQGDRYIRRWFTEGAHNKLHVDFQPAEGAQPPTSDQRRELRDWVREYAESRKPLVTFGAKSSRIDDTPQDKAAADLRVHQAQEISATYGVPPPLVGMMVTEWGQGIAELARLFFRFGAKQHLERFLAPFELRLLRKGDRFHVDTTDLLRGNPDEIAKLVMALQGDSQRKPVATRTELRRIGGLPTDPEGEFEPMPEPPAPAAEPPAEPAQEGRIRSLRALLNGDLTGVGERFHD